MLLLLDESDFFLDADAKDGSFTHVTWFKELMESTGRAVKVVFAGLHQTARFERLSNHPLAHLGNPVCVGPLTPQYAYNLLTTRCARSATGSATTMMQPASSPWLTTSRR